MVIGKRRQIQNGLYLSFKLLGNWDNVFSYILYILLVYFIYFFSKVVKRRNFVGSTKTLRNDRKKGKKREIPFLTTNKDK